MNSEEQNEIQNRLFSWHKKKNIKCPSCKSPLFHFDGRPYFSSAHIVNEIVVLHHSPCPSSIGNCGKALFFCLSCGSQSSHTSGRLQDKGCKCVRRNDNNKVSEDHPKNMTTWERGDNNAKTLRILLDMVWVILLSPILIDGVIRKLTRQWARKQTQLRRVELAMITLDMKMGGMGS